MTRANATNLRDDLVNLFEDYGVRGSVRVGLKRDTDSRWGVVVRSASPDVDVRNSSEAVALDG